MWSKSEKLLGELANLGATCLGCGQAARGVDRKHSPHACAPDELFCFRPNLKMDLRSHGKINLIFPESQPYDHLFTTIDSQPPSCPL